MRVVAVFVATATLVLAGCGERLLYAATTDRYSEICSIAEANGRLEVAEEACWLALKNAERGDLGDEPLSEKLYNLARIKRMLSKFDEGEALLVASLAIEEAASDTMTVKIGRRLVELAINLANMDRWDEAADAVDRLLPVAERYEGGERAVVVAVLEEFGRRLIESGDTARGERFLREAARLGPESA